MRLVDIKAGVQQIIKENVLCKVSAEKLYDFNHSNSWLALHVLDNQAILDFFIRRLKFNMLWLVLLMNSTVGMLFSRLVQQLLLADQNPCVEFVLDKTPVVI